MRKRLFFGLLALLFILTGAVSAETIYWSFDGQGHTTGTVVRQQAGQTWPVTDNSGSLTVDNSYLDTGLTTRASEATLSALNGKVTACNTGSVTVSTLPAITGAVTVSGTVDHVGVDTLPAITGTVSVSNLDHVGVDTLPAITGSVTVSGTATTTPAAVLSEVCSSDTPIQIKGTAGTVYAILVSGVGVTAGDKVEIKNSADNSGASLITVVADATNGTWAFYPGVGITFNTGIYFDATVSGGAFTVTIVYQ